MATTPTTPPSTTAIATVEVKAEPLAPPQLKGILPPLAERYLRQVQQAMNGTQADVSATAKAVNGMGSQGMSATITFPGGFLVGANTFHSMQFVNGLLVKVN